MQPISSWTEFEPFAGPYIRATIPPEAFVLGWKLPAAVAGIAFNGEDNWLTIDGDCSQLEYVNIVAQAITAGHPVAAVNIPTALADKLSVQHKRPWLWMLREHPFPVASVPADCRIVEPGEIDSEITRFLQLAGPDSAVWPGNPELLFWVVARNSDGELSAVAAGVQWSSGARVISSVAVMPQARREGLGSTVTLLAGQQHFARGAASVSLGVRGTNSGAIAMYRGIGFDSERDFTAFRLREKNVSDN